MKAQVAFKHVLATLRLSEVSDRNYCTTEIGIISFLSFLDWTISISSFTILSVFKIIC